MAVSKAEDFLGDSHFRRILSDPSAPADKETKRLVLCSGKIAYDLMEARDAAGDKNTQIVRVEQLYPFPGEPLTVRLKRSEEHTSELQSLMRISYAVFCFKKKNT